jgi:hypothetical protein
LWGHQLPRFHTVTFTEHATNPINVFQLDIEVWFDDDDALNGQFDAVELTT